MSYERFLETYGESHQLLQEHLDTALRLYHQALDTVPANQIKDHAIIHRDLGDIYSLVGDTRPALHHYHKSIRYDETLGNVYDAGFTRYLIADFLCNEGRTDDALHYARAALDNFQRVGVSAANAAKLARQLITRLEDKSGSDPISGN